MSDTDLVLCTDNRWRTHGEVGNGINHAAFAREVRDRVQRMEESWAEFCGAPPPMAEMQSANPPPADPRAHALHQRCDDSFREFQKIEAVVSVRDVYGGK